MSWQYCAYCGKKFKYNGGRGRKPKYCSSNCAKNANRDNTRDNMWKKRHGENSLYKYIVPNEWINKDGKPIREFSYIVQLGNSNLTEHHNPDFEKEEKLIKKEKRRLKL